MMADLPTDIALFKRDNGKLPDDCKYEPGFYCVWDNKYFIHTRAVLPLDAIETGVGFGLWVELDKTDFDKYMNAVDNDEEYKNFTAEGTLACNWPGFLNMLGVKVTVKTVNLNDTVYITAVQTNQTCDPLFEKALTTKADDKETQQMLKNMVTAYIKEVGQRQSKAS